MGINTAINELLPADQQDRIDDFLWNAYKIEFTLALLNEREHKNPRLGFNHRVQFWKNKMTEYMTQNLMKAADILVEAYSELYQHHTESGFADQFFEDGTFQEEEIHPDGLIGCGGNDQLGRFLFNMKDGAVKWLVNQDWYIDKITDELNEDLSDQSITNKEDIEDYAMDYLEEMDWDTVKSILDEWGVFDPCMEEVIIKQMYPAWRAFWSGWIEGPEQNVIKAIDMLNAGMSSRNPGQLSAAVNFALQIQHVHGNFARDHAEVSRYTLEDLSNMDSKNNIAEINQFLDMITGPDWNKQLSVTQKQPEPVIGQPKYSALDLDILVKICDSNSFKEWLIRYVQRHLPGFLAGISLSAVSAWTLWNALPSETKQQVVQEYQNSPIVQNSSLPKDQEPILPSSQPVNEFKQQPSKQIDQSKQSRGIRNNNPGNIDKGQKWQGLAPDQTDSRFATFDSPESGIRAMAVLIKNYQKKYKINTVKGIITRWAPANENDTNAYIREVCKNSGFGPDQPLNLLDSSVLFPIIKAIIHHENGTNPYTDDVILNGIKRASQTAWQYKFAIKKDITS